MHIMKQNYWLLTESFIHYLKYGFVCDIARHRAFRDQQFVQFFFSYVDKREDRQDVLLAEDGEMTVSVEKHLETQQRLG